MLSGDRQDAIHVAGAALQVNRHNGPGLGSDLVLQVRRIQVERLIDLGKNGECPGKHDGVVAGVPGPGRQDDLIAGPDAERSQRRRQGRGA